MSAYEEKEAEDKELSQAINKVRKKATKKLPHGFIAIPENPDKMYHESNSGGNIYSLARPYRCLMISDPSRGKTFQCQQLIMHAKPLFDYLFVVHPYSEGTKEWDNLDPTEYLPEIPPPDFFEEYSDGRIALVLEDYVPKTKQDKARLSAVFRWCSSHMGGGKGITVYLLYQEYISCPLICRRTSDVFVLWPGADKASQQRIERRVGLEKDQLSQLFTLCKDKRDSICIDRTPNSNFPIRLNLFTNIKQISEI